MIFDSNQLNIKLKKNIKLLYKKSKSIHKWQKQISITLG